MDSRFEVELQEDGGGSTGQSSLETSGLWPMSTGCDKAQVKSYSWFPRLLESPAFSP